jgi:hypothetical protein
MSGQIRQRAKGQPFVFVSLDEAVALDWKWVHENLIKPACKHPQTTFQSYDTQTPDGVPAIGYRRACLSCRGVC